MGRLGSPIIKHNYLIYPRAHVAGAILKASQPGLGKTELQRLDTIANLYKAYAAGLEQYVGYRKIEADIVEMKQKYAEMVSARACHSARG